VRYRLDLIVLLVIATGITLYVSLAVPGDRTLAVHVYFLAVGGIAILTLLGGVGSATPRRGRSDLRRALDEPETAQAPISELARFEREVTLGVANAQDLHMRLLPQLREIAQARLERAGKRPGPETLGRWWDLLRPDRPAPHDRFARGISERDLQNLVTDLEAL
jgi:hypothetical protein